MADTTPPTPPTPKAAAKGLGGVVKGKPAWVWVAGITVLIGVAYLAWNRGGAKPAEEETTEPQGDMAVGDYGGYYPVATQGAYGGYDEPIDWTPVVSDNAGEPEPSPITVNVTYPEPVTATGGGTPAPRTATAHAAPPTPKPQLYAGHPLSWWQNPGNARQKGKWAWPSRPREYVHTRAFAGN